MATFQGLGDLPGGAFYSTAAAVSADGSTVLGYSLSSSSYEAFRWNAADGMVGLGYLTSTDRGLDVSDDGSTIVGARITMTVFGDEAVRWTTEGGITSVWQLLVNNGFDMTDWPRLVQANGVSNDGNVIVGTGVSSNSPEAYRMTEMGGIVGLGELAGGLVGSYALAVSADGSTVVGYSYSSERVVGFNSYEAFRWTADSGMAGLGILPGGYLSRATAVSADGSIVVGQSESGSPESGRVGLAFRWTEDEGIVSLGDLPGGSTSSYASDISDDGTVVVGSSDSGSAFGAEAFRWTPGKGMESVRQLLIDSGVDLTGWHLSGAHGVSADGRVIVGDGINPNGQYEAWRAVLDEVVGLAWDEDVPRAYSTKTDETGNVDTFVSAGTTAAGYVDEATRMEIRQRLAGIYLDAGIEHISFVDGFVEGATNIYFADQLPGSNLLGDAFTEIDQYNKRHDDGVVVFLTGSTDAAVVSAAHELGHAFGLRHVNPGPEWDPGDIEVMDYHISTGVDETFINATTEIKDLSQNT